jgi:hypothetical protein
MAEADQFFTRNPLLVSVIGLDQAVLRLAPAPNSPEVRPLQDLITKTLLRPPEISENQPPDRLFEREDLSVAARFWSNRETAITRIHKALCDGVLSALVRDPDTGRFVQLVGAQWRDAALCHETILCGQICARPGEDIARYDGWAVSCSKPPRLIVGWRTFFPPLPLPSQRFQRRGKSISSGLVVQVARRPGI